MTGGDFHDCPYSGYYLFNFFIFHVLSLDNTIHSVSQFYAIEKLLFLNISKWLSIDIDDFLNNVNKLGTFECVVNKCFEHHSR